MRGRVARRAPTRARPRARGAAHCARTSRACSAAVARRRRATRDDRRREVRRRRRWRDDAVDALLDQLDGGVVGLAHDDARGARRGRLDDDEAVALAPRGQQHAAARGASRRAPRRRRRSPGRSRARDRASAAIAREHRVAFGARRRRSRRAGRAAAPPRARPPAATLRRALLGDQPPGEHDERLRGQRRARARATRRTRPRSTVTSPRSPSSRSRAACSSERQNARWRRRAQRRCTAIPRPAGAAEILAPVGRRPDLEPVDDERIAAAPAHSRGGEQREVRERGECTTS